MRSTRRCISLDTDCHAFVAESLQERITCLIAISAATSSNTALEGFEEHLDIGLIRGRANEFLKDLEKGLPAKCEHTLALDHAWALLCLAVLAPIL